MIQCEVLVLALLFHQFQTSLDSSTVPSKWRTDYATLVFRKRETLNLLTNLTSIPFKIWEHVIISAIMDYAEKHGILCPEQHGFRRGRLVSCSAGASG